MRLTQVSERDKLKEKHKTYSMQCKMQRREEMDLTRYNSKQKRIY